MATATKNQKAQPHSPTQSGADVVRPPVIAVLGHIDHGKSTLLDYIRKSNVVETEAGGITQHIAAYEIEHKDQAGAARRLTFIDTPGHEAFQKMRSRGAQAADIAILVVSAEDAVKPQTLEAKRAISEANIPYIVAITKIDKPNANIERVKANLIENEIYLEGMGGDVPYVPVSSKSGEGVPALLDMMLLVADLHELRGNPEAPAHGIVIEAKRDPKKGIAATVIVKEGALRSGEFIVAGSAYAPLRILENHLGKKATEAPLSSAVRVIGWSELPDVGASFTVLKKKSEAEELASSNKKKPSARPETMNEERLSIPLVLKADVSGSLEAIEHELAKIPQERLTLRVLSRGVGTISEGDVKTIGAKEGGMVLGFNVSVEQGARDMAERQGITIATFTIIYELAQWLTETIVARTPKFDVEEESGVVKVLKVFSVVKGKHVLGGRVERGSISVGDTVKLVRRGTEIARAKILNLQQQKVDSKRVESGEFGAQVESKIEIMPGDTLESFVVVRK